MVRGTGVGIKEKCIKKKGSLKAKDKTVHESIPKYTIEMLEKIIGIKLEDWQRRVIAENKKDIIMRCSRKSGKTTAMAFKIVLDALNNNDWFVCILSAGERQAGEVFQEVLRILYKMEVEFRTKPNASGCILANGHRILSLPTGYTGATIRTYSFHKIYLDEAAFISDEVYKAVSPCLLKHGIQKIIASTPKGERGFFYDEWERGTNFVRFYIPWWEIKHIPQENLKKIIESEKSIKGEKYIQQEYEALFTSSGSGLIPENLINQCIENNINEIKTDGTLYLGITSSPIGKNHHYIVYCYRVGNIATVSHIEIIEDSYRTVGLIKRLREISKEKNVRKVITSETSIGIGSLGEITDIFGKKRVMSVESLSFDKEISAQGRRGRIEEKDLFDNLVLMMETGRIKIFKDSMIEDALRSLDYDYKPNKENEIIISGRTKVIAEALVFAIVPFMFKRHGYAKILGSNIEPTNKSTWDSMPLFTMGDR